MNEMVSSPTKAKVSLEPDEAVELWLQGKNAWNKWVEENPEADVSFCEVEFSKHITGSMISFSNYKFPSGEVNFECANFGDNKVSFSNAKFGKGDVIFSGAMFGDARVRFCQTDFGECEVLFDDVTFGKGLVYFYKSKFRAEKLVSFKNTNFGEGDVNFSLTEFSKAFVDFSKAKFIEGNINFEGTQFGQGVVQFTEAEFGEGIVSFYMAQFEGKEANFIGVNFGKGFVSFREVQFGDADVSFDWSEFGGGDVFFDNAVFGKGIVSFYEVKFGEGKVNFDNVDFHDTETVNFTRATFKNDFYFNPYVMGYSRYCFQRVEFLGSVDFIYSGDIYKASYISFKFSKFEKAINILGCFDCIPDLTNTKINHQVVVDHLYYNLKRKGKLFLKAEDPEDEARLRRLKELAEDNKDHESALAFHADEMRAKRWHNAGFWASILDLLFDKTSNYGQSVYLPSMWLLGLNLWVTLLFYIPWPSTLEEVGEAFKLSAINTFPFISGSKDIRSSSIQELFCSVGTTCTTPDAVFIIQGLLSFIFLFLIGLGLRNRFRI